MTNDSKKSARELIAKKQQVTAPNKTAVTVSDADARRKEYLDQLAPNSGPGRLIKFTKDGSFITHDDGVKVAEDAKFIALAEQTMAGFMRFNGAGELPDRSHMSLYFGDDFAMPRVEDLPDRDQRQWEAGFDGEAEDPWKHHVQIPLQHVATGELFYFDTASPTGLTAVGKFLRHYGRLRVMFPGELPIVRLATTGFTSKKKGVGWVDVPALVNIGRWPANGTVAKPDELDDEPSFDV
jgi:hypothetical protein